MDSCVTILRQSQSKFLMNGFSMLNGGITAIACYMGINRPRPPVMPKDACWIFPDIFGTC